MFELFFLLHLMITVFAVLSWTPLILSLLIILYAMAQGIFCFFMLSKWLGVSIIMVFIGGMMIVFMYATSLTSNMKIMSGKSPMTPILVMSVFVVSGCCIYAYNKWSAASQPMLLFKPEMWEPLPFLIFYLLITLFVVTKVTESFKGALIQKF